MGTKVGSDGGPKTTFSLENVVEQQNEQAVRDGLVSLAGAPIVIPPGMKGAPTSAKKSGAASEWQFRQTGDAPPPPAPDGANPQAAKGVSDSFGFVGSLGGDVMGNLFAVMIAYQKMMNKEARDDRKLARDDKALELQMKAGKLEMESKKIDQMKVEAGERFEHAMHAADMELVMGCISIGAAALSAVSAGAGSGIFGKASESVTKGLEFASKALTLGEKIANTAISYSIADDKNFADKQKADGLASDKMQQAINSEQGRIDKQTNAAEGAKDFADAARDRRKSGLDNIQKLLDIIRSINPNI